MTQTAETFAAILTAAALSLGTAILLERALFRALLKAMFTVPRRIEYRWAEARMHLRQLRRAGM